GPGNDTYERNLQDDGFTPGQFGAFVTVDLVEGELYGADFPDDPDIILNFENARLRGEENFNLVGTDGDNRLQADQGDDTLIGAGGNDTLFDGAGDDSVDAGAGDDVVITQGGTDTYIGGDGNDTLVTDVNGIAFNTAEIDLVAGIQGRVGSTVGQDSLSGFENVDFYGEWNVIITGDGNDNFLRSDAGDDTLIGGDGDDRLQAGSGDDSLDGGDGRDRLFGGDGNDTLDASGG
ncbi:calcium-binding protein, partial [Aestuariicoccus sp. MJ-SS9]|uniref:calcium-binding protein n=1 Tax=Aestuariicoccus sp. MJ-SS9 TaxID=3079855 RepID=UPI0029097556|nr:hypothetical protein [Aestuariicoccus sp. MJ-SS9]